MQNIRLDTFINKTTISIGDNMEELLEIEDSFIRNNI
jgi:hypothetical protein